MKLSVVTTLYKSSPYVLEFYERMTKEAKKITDDYEIIFVNDGSPDDSLEIVWAIHKKDPRVCVIDLSRNFGHHEAIMAGLTHCRGEQVFLLDCDLEEQPEWLPMFVSQLESSKVDVVYGVQGERVASRCSNYMGDLFWKVINFMSHVEIPCSPMTCRLMTERYVSALLQVNDRVLYLAGTFAWAGFEQKKILLKKHSRPYGEQKTSYNLGRKLVQVGDSFASFNSGPLVLIFISGVAIWIGSIVYTLYLFLVKLFDPSSLVSGFTSLMVSVWFLGGMIIVSLGILGLYVSKIFQEVKRRPLFIVKNIYREDANESRKS